MVKSEGILENVNLNDHVLPYNWMWIEIVFQIHYVTLVLSYIRYVFEYPLYFLYLNGPSYMGCWFQLPLIQICEQLTSVSHNHWQEHWAVCESLVHQRFMSFMYTLYIVLYYIVLFIVCRGMYRLCSFR